MDKTLQELLTLEPWLQLRAWYHIAYLRYYGWPAVITQGRRTLAQQRQFVAAGTSKTLNSYHLYGRAWDVTLQGMTPDQVDARYPDFYPLAAQIAKWLGVRWGGSWRSIVDKPHFEV